MKRVIKILALTITVLMLSVPVFANNSYFDSLYDTSIANVIKDNGIKVQLNGKYLDFTDEKGNKVEPQIINDRTMVPMRKIFEVFGANVEWIGETRSIKANTEELEIGLQIDNKMATVKNKNGEVKQIELDSVPVIRDSRTLVPVRFIAESLDKKVGWDSYNRTVIIIDLDIIENTLKEKTPNFYEYLSIVPEKMTTAEMSLVLDGKYQVGNDYIKANGNLDMKISEKVMAFEIDIELEGSNSVMQEIKDENLEKISVDVVLDMENFIAYIKSPLIKDYENKWIKYAAELSEEEMLEAKNLIEEYFEKQNGSIIDVLSVFIAVNENLTITSYSELESILQIICMVMSNDNFTVSGTTNKTYKFQFDMQDLIKIFGVVGGYDSLEEIEDSVDFEILFDSKYENNVAKETNFKFNLSEIMYGEKNAIEFSLKSIVESYNEEVNITIPSGKNIIDGNKIQEEESSRGVEQAAFSGFTQEMGFLQDNVRVAMLTAKGTEAINGNQRTDAQLYNFVARGGYSVVTEKDWLSKESAKNIQYTEINKEYAEESLGARLPNRKVKTENGTEKQMSYYVTPMGNVFCFPPYEFDGKLYITPDKTVENATGKQIEIKFENYNGLEEKIIFNNK